MAERPPNRVEYALAAADQYKRRTLLIGERQNNNTMIWTIKSNPVEQRDEGEIIRSLTTEQLAEIGEIVGQYKGRGHG